MLAHNLHEWFQINKFDYASFNVESYNIELVVNLTSTYI